MFLLKIDLQLKFIELKKKKTKTKDHSFTEEEAVVQSDDRV